MFGDILDLILFPIKELLKLLLDQRITDYLGFSPMAGIVTLLVITIVVKALVNTTYVGSAGRSIHNITVHISESKANEQRAHDEAVIKATKSRH